MKSFVRCIENVLCSNREWWVGRHIAHFWNKVLGHIFTQVCYILHIIIIIIIIIIIVISLRNVINT
jgi:hypothetical protein